MQKRYKNRNGFKTPFAILIYINATKLKKRLDSSQTK